MFCSWLSCKNLSPPPACTPWGSGLEPGQFCFSGDQHMASCLVIPMGRSPPAQASTTTPDSLSEVLFQVYQRFVILLVWWCLFCYIAISILKRRPFVLLFWGNFCLDCFTNTSDLSVTSIWRKSETKGEQSRGLWGSSQFLFSWEIMQGNQLSAQEGNVCFPGDI